MEKSVLDNAEMKASHLGCLDVARFSGWSQDFWNRVTRGWSRATELDWAAAEAAGHLSIKPGREGCHVATKKFCRRRSPRHDCLHDLQSVIRRLSIDPPGRILDSTLSFGCDDAFNERQVSTELQHNISLSSMAVASDASEKLRKKVGQKKTREFSAFHAHMRAL
jgi:hypothetical protein